MRAAPSPIGVEGDAEPREVVDGAGASSTSTRAADRRTAPRPARACPADAGRRCPRARVRPRARPGPSSSRSAPARSPRSASPRRPHASARSAVYSPAAPAPTTTNCRWARPDTVGMSRYGTGRWRRPLSSSRTRRRCEHDTGQHPERVGRIEAIDALLESRGLARVRARAVACGRAQGARARAPGGTRRADRRGRGRGRRAAGRRHPPQRRLLHRGAARGRRRGGAGQPPDPGRSRGQLGSAPTARRVTTR